MPVYVRPPNFLGTTNRRVGGDQGRGSSDEIEHVGHFAYLGVLVFTLIGTVWLEVFLRARVYSKLLRLTLTVLPVVVVFVMWDLYAISVGHWTFDPQRTTGVVFAGGLPLDEVLFFVVIPIAAILTLEAVRSMKRWQVGDEPTEACVNGLRVDDSGDLR